MSAMDVIVLMGAPGSGKGTIASGLTRGEMLWQHVSSGDLLREAVRQGTILGMEAAAFMQRGELVPDELVSRMISNFIAGLSDEATVLLDGFPRTLDQVRLLDEALNLYGAKLDSVVQLEVEDQVIVDRIAGRRICSGCGASYHVAMIPPQREGVCDKCGARLIVRSDDCPETVQRRLEAYKHQIEPLSKLYQQRSLLHRIDGVGPIDEVIARVKKVL